MGYDYHGHTFPGQLLHNRQNLTDHLRVKGRGRLVEEHDIRLHSQGTGNSHTLLLSAGELAWECLRLICQADTGQKLHGFFPGLVLGHNLQMDRSQRHIVHHIQMVEQIKMLEHHTDVLTHLIDIRVLVRHVIAVYQNLACRRRLQLVQAAQKGGFTASGGSQENHNLAFGDIHTDILQNLQLSKVLFQVRYMNLIICHGLPSSLFSLPAYLR